MPMIEYKPKNFRVESLDVIEDANLILAEYDAQGYVLTLRQLYYQFVARDLIENTDRSYKRLGSVINDARLAGLIDWDHLTDRTRNLQSQSHWDSPEQIVRAIAGQYHVDMWEGQGCRVEVWVEKDALIDVVGQACEPCDVPYFSCRGYTSQSEMWAAGERLMDYVVDEEATPIVVHLGDHDPSGIDMSRDIEERLRMFLQIYSGKLRFERIALNMDQIEEHGPPPNPAKVTDARFRGYQKEYGEESWELDSLEPAVITSLIRDCVGELVDDAAWDVQWQKETAGRDLLTQIADNWPDEWRV